MFDCESADDNKFDGSFDSSGFDPDEVVVNVVGKGQDKRSLVHVRDWSLTAFSGRGDEEPRIQDLDLARRLGFSRPRDIRKLIERLETDNKIIPFAVFRSARHRGAPVEHREYWLSEADALKVTAKSETDEADALLDEMIKVYMLARRGLLRPVADNNPPAWLHQFASMMAIEINAVFKQTNDNLEAIRKEVDALRQKIDVSDHPHGQVGLLEAGKILAELRGIATLRATPKTKEWNAARTKADRAVRRAAGVDDRAWHKLDPKCLNAVWQKIGEESALAKGDSGNLRQGQLFSRGLSKRVDPMSVN